MKGLKEKLNQLIKEQGTVSLDQVYAFAKGLGHKEKTAERELNPSRSPNILTLKNEKHQIYGYKYIDPSSYVKSELVKDDYYFSDKYYQDKKTKEVKSLNGQISLNF